MLTSVQIVIDLQLYFYKTFPNLKIRLPASNILKTLLNRFLKASASGGAQILNTI